MFEKIGFFHFGKDHSAPVRALEAALDEADDPTGSLIVLPEGFNLGVEYRSDATRIRNFQRSTVRALKRLANRFKTTFVAGLIIKQFCGPNPPYSAAWLIAETVTELICFKSSDDGCPGSKAGSNYTTRPLKRADPRNPITHDGMRIGALVCSDANPLNSWGDAYVQRIRTLVDASDIICVPAHMSSDNFGGGRSGHKAALITPWKNKFLILANSRAEHGVNSFLTDGNGVIVEPTASGSENRVITVPWPLIQSAR